MNSPAADACAQRPQRLAWGAVACGSFALNLLVFILAKPSYLEVYALVNYLDFAAAAIFGIWAARLYPWQRTPISAWDFLVFATRGPIGSITLGHGLGLAWGMMHVAEAWVGAAVTVISTSHTLLAGWAGAAAAMLLSLPGRPRRFPPVALGLLIGGGGLYSAYTAYGIYAKHFAPVKDPGPAQTIVDSELFAIDHALRGEIGGTIGLSINAATVVAIFIFLAWARYHVEKTNPQSTALG